MTSACASVSATWAAVVTVVVGCAGAPDLTPPASSQGHETVGGGTAWIGWARITAPDADSEQLECVRQTGTSRVALSRSAEGRVGPTTVVSPPEAVSLPFEPETPLPGGHGNVGQVISRSDGYFVTVDQGEWGGGLFWVAQDTRHAERVGAAENDAIRWIAEVGFGTLAVSGLCHGDACASSSRIFLVEPAPSRGWQLKALAELAGCPAHVSVEPGAAAVLLGACGALYRVNAQGAASVARWNPVLLPQDVQTVTEGTVRVYYISFGAVVARFETDTAPMWFAPRACAHFVVGTDGRCTCTATP